MVDEARVYALLRVIGVDLDVLRAERDAAAERRADPIWLRGVKYTLVTAVEGCIDVAQHMAASESWGPPHDNGDALRLLARHGVVAPEVAENLARAVGFRNILVHEYVTVNDDIVLGVLDDPSDLEAFVAGVLGWLDRAGL